MPALPLGLLLLPPRQLLQLLGELVDLLIAGLLLGLLLHLVLVRQLVELELEQVGEVFGHLALPAAAATAAAVLLRDLRLVLLLDDLQDLQRALLGRQRRVGLHRLQIGLRPAPSPPPPSAAASAIERNARIERAEPLLQLADELFDLLAQLRLREVQEDDVLAVLVGFGLRLVANGVERRGDDFALLARELADRRRRRRRRHRRRACDCACL